MIAYKFLRPGGVAPYTGFRWPVGEWVDAAGVDPCRDKDPEPVVEPQRPDGQPRQDRELTDRDEVPALSSHVADQCGG